VRIQYELLRVAERLDDTRWAGDAPDARVEQAQRSVMSRVRAVAPTPEQLDALGTSSHPDVEAILGSDITERATKTCTTGNLKHVTEYKGLLAFRPLRAGTTRALVAQLVAYDTNGAPHITPVVDGMELRLGNETSSP